MTDETEREPRRIPLSRMRRAIAKAMTASALVPQFTIEIDADLSAVQRAHTETKEAGTPVSVADFLVCACAEALVVHPQVNASFDEDAIVEHAVVNVGVAIALDEGLISPAILAADELTIHEIAAERVRLTEAAWANSLTIEEAMSATFTISNLGPLGVTRFRALVVPPQAAILGVGATRPVGLTSLSLSCDHRVLDGAPASLFLHAVVERLQSGDWVRATLG